MDRPSVTRHPSRGNLRRSINFMRSVYSVSYLQHVFNVMASDGPGNMIVNNMPLISYGAMSISCSVMQRM